MGTDDFYGDQVKATFHILGGCMYVAAAGYSPYSGKAEWGSQLQLLQI